ncbi:DUF2235 domain-containing protein [Rhodococcus rhodochrous]|uniref:DUF2235 domain-containing protein n=1 Tax=Rhodococcus rhodochrous TaxID=1829 RepID=UPI001364C047|nr:DUF2235 domain-containing protein [Rhodococcus rhodochrous]
METIGRSQSKKRLVICCDGTWNRPDSKYVTNIEKIARTVQTDVTKAEGVQQLVLYLSGVGAGSYMMDRLLGGAFGMGLFANIRSAYRFLALNYEPGDEIYVFGFSRGAYTARSLVGMLARAGLLTRAALIADKLPDAIARYQTRTRDAKRFGSSNQDFRRDHCHSALKIQFLGVFDTVGALGVPGPSRRRYEFHDVKLSDLVVCARQALAIDERRMTFEPCLWESDDGCPPDDPRVKQVWFEGVHSDIGGGYAECGLSDTALLWMVRQAHEQGLVFDSDLLAMYLARKSPAVRHQSMRPAYRLLNVIHVVRGTLRRHRNKHFLGTFRNLAEPECVGTRIAASAVTRHLGDGYGPRNLVDYKRTSNNFDGVIEDVVALPHAITEAVIAELAAVGGDPPRSHVDLELR